MRGKELHRQSQRKSSSGRGKCVCKYLLAEGSETGPKSPRAHGAGRQSMSEGWQRADHQGRALEARYSLYFYSESDGGCLEALRPRVRDRICFWKQITLVTVQ